MDWSKNIIAIRPLLSEHHALNIEPTIVNVIWNLGKRCNYDCSYCNPGIHDWISPHLDINIIKEFIDHLDKYYLSLNKKFDLTVTGGEPYTHPDILKILEYVYNKKATAAIKPVSNGSLPIELYEKSFEYISNLTISLHLERSDKEIFKKIENIIYLNKKYPDKLINVQLMCLPGKFDFIDSYIIPTLETNNVKYVCRRIRPWVNQAVDEWTNKPKRKILKQKDPLEKQTKNKKLEKVVMQDLLKTVYTTEEYYTSKELEYLKNKTPKTFWQNIGVWVDDLNYYETNSDQVVSNNKNSFKGWKCFTGIDGLFIDFDGNIYKGICTNDGAIGNIYNVDKIKFPSQPTVCQMNFCISNPDLTTRKSMPEYLNLITQQVDTAQK